MKGRQSRPTSYIPERSESMSRTSSYEGRPIKNGDRRAQPCPLYADLPVIGLRGRSVRILEQVPAEEVELGGDDRLVLI